MKVSVLQDRLAWGLKQVGHAVASRAVAARATLPFTTHVLLRAEESRLHLMATNLEIAISCWIGAKVEAEGAIAVPARLLNDFVSSLQHDRLDMELAPATRQLHLTSGRVQARLSGQDAEDFPPIPNVGEGVTLELEADQLRTAIERVAFAAATDDAIPVLTGIDTSLQGDTLTLAAADGFRLAVQTLRLALPVLDALHIIIPARSLRELHRLFDKQGGYISVTFNKQRSQIFFRLKNAELVSQLLQGTFLNYCQLIPKDFTTRAVVDMGEFLRATRIGGIFGRRGGTIRLYMTSGADGTVGTLRLVARDEEVGEDERTIDALIEGPEAQIALDSRYLADILGVLGKGKVALEVTSPSSPAVLRPVDADSYVHVVMPMFVQW